MIGNNLCRSRSNHSPGQLGKSDKGRGSLYSPFATVERALSEAARYAGDSVEIRIREGMYPLGRTIDVKGYSNLLMGES